jgi:hypothetical protein
MTWKLLRDTGRIGALSGLLVAALAVQPTPAMAVEEGFMAVSFCNETSTRGWLAVVHARGPRDFVAVIHGWTELGANSCSEVDMPRGQPFYYYAETSAGGIWSASDAHFCIERPGPFSRTGSTVTCEEANLVGFIKVYPGDNDGWTVHLR